MRRIVLRRQKLMTADGRDLGEITLEVTDDDINTLLMINDADIGVKEIKDCRKDPKNVPTDKAGKRAKLKKFGYQDSDLDILEKEGVI
jgi:hypothetical protein